jgi:hypothetical protein
MHRYRRCAHLIACLWLLTGCVQATATPALTATTAPPIAVTASPAPTAAPLPPTATALPYTSPAWFKTAALYQIFVRSFYDSNGDGIGDLRGIT